MSKKTFFQDCWLIDPAFNSWLEKVNNDLRIFQCKFCKSQLSLSNMGKRTIISHTEGQKHEKNLPSNCILKTVKKTFFQPPRPKGNNSNNSIKQSQTLVTLTLRNSEIIIAEIYWAFKSIYNFLLSSGGDTKSLFTNMFPDSNVANSFSMSKEKFSYVINFGIAPYIRDMLVENVKRSTFFSIGFDESFNETLHECQMDFVV